MNLEPLYDMIIIEEHTEEVSEGGIVLGEAGSEAATRATVLAVGTGRMNEDGKIIPLRVKVGDVVCFSSGFGSLRETLQDGKEVMIISEADVLAIVRDAPTDPLNQIGT